MAAIDDRERSVSEYETFFSRLKRELEAQEAVEEAEHDAQDDERDATGTRAHDVSPALHGHDDPPVHPGPVGVLRRVPFVVWTLLGLLGGMAAGALAEAAGGFTFTTAAFVGSTVKGLFGVIADLAPVIIFFTLTPALVSMFRISSVGLFATSVLVGFTLTTTVGGLWALLVTYAFFPDMPLGFGAQGLGGVLAELAAKTWDLAFSSPPFRAIWGAVLTSLLLYFGGGLRHPAPTNHIRRILWTIADIYELVGVHGVAYLGRGIKKVMPYVLFAIGIFLVITLPREIARRSSEATAEAQAPPFGPVEGYFVAVGILIVITLIWLGVAGLAVGRYTRFPLKRLFRDYFGVVYPFAWATSSSAASIPINMEATRDGLHVRAPIRSFIVPLGATVNLDGTMMSAVVTTVVAAKMAGYTPSVVDLLVALIPLVVITVGTPGIPGGLAAVAGPVLATLLPLPPGTEALFTGIFFAYGFGLNDQFRTAVNTLDNGLLCLLFEKWWPMPSFREAVDGLGRWVTRR